MRIESNPIIYIETINVHRITIFLSNKKKIMMKKTCQNTKLSQAATFLILGSERVG